jgi:hypothetical protein
VLDNVPSVCAWSIFAESAHAAWIPFAAGIFVGVCNFRGRINDINNNNRSRTNNFKQQRLACVILT